MEQRVEFQSKIAPFFQNRLTCGAVQGYVLGRLGKGKFASVFGFKGPATLAKLFPGYGVAVKPLWLVGNRRVDPSSRVTDNHYRAPKPFVELFMLMLMSGVVEQRLFPNFPLLYSVSLCGKGRRGGVNNNLTNLTNRTEDVALVFTERADADLAAWLEKRPPAKAVSSAVAQCLLAVFAFRAMGFAHNDAHAKNFLLHRLRPGGYWHYRLFGRNVYVQNHGQQVVLWDPMLATRTSANAPAHDANRVALSIAALTNYDRETLEVLGVFVRQNITPKYPDAVLQWLDHVKAMGLDDIVVDRLPPGSVINAAPYLLPKLGKSSQAFDELLARYVSH